MASVGDNLELKLSFNADENIKQCSPFGKGSLSCAVSERIKQTLTMIYRHPSPRYLPKGNEGMCPQEACIPCSQHLTIAKNWKQPVLVFWAVQQITENLVP